MKAVLLLLLTIVGQQLYSVSIDTSGQPSIGNPKAPVQVVALLEPKCPDSKAYNDNSFPRLRAEYIDTNKIQYTVILTSFLPQSMPAAIALLGAYYQQPNPPHTDLFFKYLDYTYRNLPPERENWATTPRLLQFASKVSPEIDQKQLQRAIERGHYRSQIEKNTAYGNRLMGHLSTPTIFVNGVKVENKDDTIDYDNLKKAIDNALPKS